MDEETTTLLLASPPRRWRLRFLTARKERVRVLSVGDCLVVGSGAEADLTLEDPTVSACHCRIEVTKAGLLVSDQASKNGLYAGGSRVPTALLSQDGSAFSIGHTTVLAEAKEAGDPGPGRSAPDDLGLAGDSDAIASVRAQIRQVARLTAPVLVLGESGTGKDVVAMAIHRLSGRGGPYLPLNMAAFSEGLIDAELFGHQRGSFTGAEASRPGAFEQAHGGTLFLDEIADFSPSGQAKLLRVIEDGMIRAVGSAAARKVDVRLISATCAPLQARVLEERFRHDLYHRLSTLVVEVPPLRSRRSDIPVVARGLLQRMSSEVGHKHLSPSALDLLMGANFPGNVRELMKTLYRAAALHAGDVIEPGHLELSRESTRGSRLDYRTASELVSSHGSISAAARAAGVPRTTLRSVLERHGPLRAPQGGARDPGAFVAGEVDSRAAGPGGVRETSISR